jgi:hypothetical protein
MAILTAEFWAKCIDRMFRVLEKQGLATVIVLAVGYFTAIEIVIPFRDAGIRFLDRVATSTEISADGVQKLSVEMGSLSDSMASINIKLSRALPQPASDE